MTKTSRILWWCLLALGVFLAWKMAHGAPTQGAGASALLRGIRAAKGPSVPKAVVVPGKPPAVYYFACTAHDATGLESDFSNEVAFTNSGKRTAVALAWDASAGTNIAGYAVYRGRASSNYTNVTQVGNFTNATIQLVASQPTNVVVTVSGLSTNWTATNPPGMRLWKGRGMTISMRRF